MIHRQTWLLWCSFHFREEEHWKLQKGTCQLLLCLLWWGECQELAVLHGDLWCWFDQPPCILHFAAQPTCMCQVTKVLFITCGHCNLWSAQHEYILSVHITIWWTGLQFVDSILQSNSKQQLISAGVRVQNLFYKSFLDISCHCWRRRESSVCLWIEPFFLPQFRMQNAKESWKLMMQQTWSQIVAMRLPSTPGPTTNKSFSLLLHMGSAQKSCTSATISKEKYLWNEDKKPVQTLEKVHMCVCVCVWWASRNLHEARTRLKLLLLSQKKTSRKRT